VLEAYDAWSQQIDRLVKSEKTAMRYIVSMGQLKPYLTSIMLDEVNAKLLSSIVEDRRKKVTDATIKRDLLALSSVIKYAGGKGWIDSNPVLSWLALDQVNEKETLIVLPRAEDIALVKQRAAAMIGHLIDAAIVTGARQDELATAERANIDHKHKTFTVVGKRNKRRTIPLDRFDAYRVLTDVPTYVGSPVLFWHDKGEAYSTLSGQFYRVVEETAKWAKREKVDFKKFTFHSLRHLYAINSLKDGMSIYTLQSRLGHTSVATTERYLRAESGYLTAEEIHAAKFGKAVNS
jgi:integrase/recombinase XerD